MLGVLAEQLFGWPFWVGILLGSLLSVVYVYLGGFNAVVRTDLLQFALMFLGFAVLLIILVSRYGGWSFIVANVPETHLTWHGGRPGLYIASWYFIALATLIEPAFYQRCYAARSEGVARSGILLSIACWAVFDFMTTSCGLYARALLPELADPVASYPALATTVLPVGLLGLFLLALLATVMSTVDSYAFLSASTFGNDILRRLGLIGEAQVVKFTRLGLIVTMVLAVGLAMFFRSVVEIWYVFGSIGTPALLIPVFTAFVGRRRLSSAGALISVAVSTLVSLVWWLSQFLTGTGGYWWDLEPVLPGLAVSLLIFLLAGKSRPRPLPK
jgi:SSS family solute:Na+ symporter